MTKRNPRDIVGKLTVGKLTDLPPDQFEEVTAAWDRAFGHFNANADWYTQVNAARKRFTTAALAGLEDESRANHQELMELYARAPDDINEAFEPMRSFIASLAEEKKSERE